MRLTTSQNQLLKIEASFEYVDLNSRDLKYMDFKSLKFQIFIEFKTFTSIHFYFFENILNT